MTEDSNFCKQLPKIELHAHLNGSLSTETLRKLGCVNENISEYQKLTKQLGSREERLQQCFTLFKIAHNATSDERTVYQATKYVIEEFSDENVVYLELRTTPREQHKMTKLQYIEAVVKGIQDSKKDIITKLLLSIDRSSGLETMLASMSVIIKMKKKYPTIIKGVDFCGDPNAGSFNTALFKQARDNDLFISLHCGEVKNANEIKEILQFEPDRIGHGTFIHPKYGGAEECWQMYQAKKIPLECCLTSNVLCGTVNSYEEHHVQEWIQHSLPYTLCTDDKGVFGTSLSQEYALAARHFKLRPQDLWKINYDSVDYSFASTAEKKNLQKILEDWKLKNGF